jgi:DNA-binding HxlR family transcriptional regulator
MKRKRFDAMPCPIARTLDIVGEWWTLLIVRDALVGARRFEQFKESGIADNILSARLDLLVREGILQRRRYQEHPPRFEYLLTGKGRDLLPVVVSLGAWGLKWTDTSARAPQLRHIPCGTELGFDFHCPRCARIVPPAEVEVRRPAAPAPAGQPAGADHPVTAASVT